MEQKEFIKDKTPALIPSELVTYHGYILSNILGVSFPLVDTRLTNLIKIYFINSAIIFPWHGHQIIEYCKSKSSKEILKEAKTLFEDLSPTVTPKKIQDLTKSLPEDFLSSLVAEIKQRLEEIKDEDEIATLLIKQRKASCQPKSEEQAELATKPKVVQESLVEQIAEQVHVKSDNEEEDKLAAQYKYKFGKRFRLTAEEKEQVDAGKVTRLSLLKNKLK